MTVGGMGFIPERLLMMMMMIEILTLKGGAALQFISLLCLIPLLTPFHI